MLLKGEKMKSVKGKVILAICLSIVAIIGGISLYFVITKPKLKYDYERGAMASVKVENAQYMPDIDSFIATQKGLLFPADAQSEYQNKLDEFNALVDNYAQVENYAGAGKYLGYDIYEIKNEIQYVVDHVPAFNQWFRLPTMREEEGYAKTPYYEYWAYYLEMNDDVLSITRVCLATRSEYLDFDKRKTVEYYDKNGNESFIQYEIMKTNYYVDADNKEVVECYFYSVGVDHAKRGFYGNANKKDYYPFEYQYLKNVKDTSLIKYHITTANRYSSEESFDEGGMDIRGLTPYGIRREFIIADYDGYRDINVTEIDQKFATLDHPEYDGAVSFNLNDENIKLLVESVGLPNDKYESSNTAKNLMDQIAKQIIDNFELKNNWADIYRDSSNAIEIELIKGPHYGQKLLFSNLKSLGEVDNGFGCSAHIETYDFKQFDQNKEYSLSTALREKTTGKIYVVATNYVRGEPTKYTNGKLTGEYIIYSDTGFSNLDIDSDGEYVVTLVVTEKVNGKDVIIFDTKEDCYVRRYKGLEISDSVDSKGVTHHYKCSGRGGKLTITVSSGN